MTTPAFESEAGERSAPSSPSEKRKHADFGEGAPESPPSTMKLHGTEDVDQSPVKVAYTIICPPSGSEIRDGSAPPPSPGKEKHAEFVEATPESPSLTKEGDGAEHVDQPPATGNQKPSPPAEKENLAEIGKGAEDVDHPPATGNQKQRFERIPMGEECRSRRRKIAAKLEKAAKATPAYLEKEAQIPFCRLCCRKAN